MVSGLREDPVTLKTHSRCIFTHVTGLKPFDSIIPEDKRPGLTQRWHVGTLHHCFKGGWYWIIPFDFIPDPFPRIGRFDDRVALALACWCAVRLARVPFQEHLTRIEYLREVEAARFDDMPPEEPSTGAPGS